MAGRWTARRVPEKAMYRAGWWLSWAIGIGACFAAGCHLPKPRKPYPPDPLFESKQPLQRTTRPTERPTLLASAIPDPRPPQFPQVLLASPFVPPPPPPDHVRDIFAADRAPPAPAPASPALPAAQTHPRSTDGAEESAAPPPALGHAEDYHWLVGVLDKHYDGRFMLRYADAGERWGGKVWLEPTALLAPFADGDILRVEGMLLPRLGPPPADRWDDFRRYRITAVTQLR